MRGIHEILETNENPHHRTDEHFGARAHEDDRTEYRSFETNLADKKRRDASFNSKNEAILKGILDDIVGQSTQKVRTLDDMGELLIAAAVIDGMNNSRRDPRQRFLGMDGVHSAIDATPPFIKFWQRLNDARADSGLGEAGYGEARRAFNGGATPVGSLTFIGKQWDGLRAVPSTPVKELGGLRPSYHGEYREVTDHGTIWHKVINHNDLPIVYALPEAALTAAELVRNEKISRAFR